MSIVSDLISLVRPPPPPAKPAKGEAPEPAPPASAEELSEALRRLDEERAEANRIILDAAKQRESLLLEPDSDDVILQLDAKVDRTHIFRERLDKLRPQLAGKLQELNARHRQEEWGRLVERYIAQGRTYVQLLAQAEEARW
ncbi:MAG: hypothetical protein JOY71_23495, partial [Acetobacteraceae bacterium]|nr:hypothetical protein [Acetobacteraceae bacterium]